MGDRSLARSTIDVLGSPIDVVSPGGAVARIAEWASRRESRYVCICNAHSVVTAKTDKALDHAIKHADMATADGAPVAWMLRRMGAFGQQRVSGPDLMLEYCAHAARIGEPIYLYGSTEHTLSLLSDALQLRFPGLRVVGTESPPFRPATPEEDQATIQRINEAAPGTVWVSLGCPKQEAWMARHQGSIKAVMVGVGAAFDFHAGTVPRAPDWMRNGGLEWLHRLFSEPRRLWRRYLVTNTAFIAGALKQLWLRATQAK